MPEHTPLTDLVLFSGGVSSWAAAKRVSERKGTDGMVLLFADTLIEDADLYRFIAEAAEDVGAPLVRISEGRTPWEVMWDERIIGNSRFDPCSKILKRKLLDEWRNEHCDPEITTCYVGLDWTEQHRIMTLLARTAPWRYEAPLCEAPALSKAKIISELRDKGIAPPRLYAQGFPHNNCGGECIKAGQAQWALLLRTNRPRFLEREQWEQDMRLMVGDHSILRDRSGSKSKVLTLREFRERLDQQPDMFDCHEWGGCACGA